MNLPSIVHHPNAPPHLAHHHHGHYRGHSMHQFSSAPHSFASRPPAPPPSPPVEDNSKCSLPSISTLLVFADGPQGWSQQAPAPRVRALTVAGADRQQQNQRLPPTPPMRPDSVFDNGHHSPTMASESPPNYYYQGPAAHNPHRNSYPPAQKSGYPASPTELSYAAAQAYYGGGPQQHQLDAYGKIMVPPPSSANPWHHHHHQSPASHAAFPQTQDRYICQTCNKAFSRPSSLRIHSHSHTGEKPFKCPHHGCGKAFSVRSNMKRHERGCHQ